MRTCTDRDLDRRSSSTDAWLKCLNACAKVIHSSYLNTHHHNSTHMVAEQRRSAMSSIAISIVPLLMEEILDVVRLISQEHTQQRIIEETAAVPIPQLQEHLVEMTEVIPQDDSSKACCIKSSDQTTDDAKVLARQGTGRQDAMDDYNKDQLSNADARIEAVEKSISELHESVINNGAATELLKLAVNRLQAEAPFEVRNTSYRDEVTSQVTEKKEDLEADTAKHSSVLETAVSRSTLDGEVSSRDRISQHTIEQTLDVPMPEMVKQLVEVPKIMNRIQQRTMKQIVDDPVVQVVQIPQVHVVEKTAEILVMTQRQNHMVQTVQMPMETPQLQIVEKTVEAVKHIQQERVKELKSKFEVGHTNKVHARNQPDKNRWRKKQEFEATQYPQDVQERADLTNQRQVPAIRSVQKTVEVPRVQYVDKVADIPVDMQRQVSTTQATQDIEEVEDVPALTQSEVPNIPDDDEDWLEQESKKRKLPVPAETVFESRADESDFDRFDGLVLPSPEGKTLFENIASGDETVDEPEKQHEMTRCLVQGGELMVMVETDVQSPEQEMVQAIHAEWVQELRDVKNELMHVRELVGVLVRRERSAENKAEVAARRLDRMEREQTEADDVEHEANLSRSPREPVEGREGGC